MALPDASSPGGAWNPNDQHRMEVLDAELVNALAVARQAILKAVSIKQRFVALNLSSRWPSLVTDYVHQKPEAQTRQEQVDASQLIDFMNATLINGAAGPITPAQASSFLARYAR